MLYNLERVIRELFTPEEADSLCTILYPEKQRPSIAFQFFAIPLNYIPALFRWIISPFASLRAWFNERQDWWVPMKNASKNLFVNLAWRDLTRLIIFTKEVVSAVSTIIATPIKLIANLLMLSLSRVTALFGVNIGHDLHVAAAQCACWYI